VKSIYVIILLAILAPAAARADDFASLADARKFTDKVVELFKEEKMVEGYASLKPYWPLPSFEIDNLANQTKMQWPIVSQRFGKPVGTEFVKQLDGGPSLARFIYLQKFQNHAIRWLFTFYKPKDRWVINSVSFDDQINTLF